MFKRAWAFILRTIGNFIGVWQLVNISFVLNEKMESQM